MHHSSSTSVSEVLTPTHNAISLPRVKTTMENSTTQSAASAANESSDKDRGSIYTHPLFPLMALLFEKCEQATQSPDPPTSDSFDVDIEEFVDRQKREGKAFFCDDTEVDNLMIKAIQVLRIHLLELEKVNELCQDFCHRYITCLKGKMHSENLLKEERSSSTPLDETASAVHSVNDQLQNTTMQLETQFTQPQYQTAVMNSGGQVVYAPVYPHGVMTPGLVTQAIPGAVQLQAAANSHNHMVIHGSTPLSQIGIAQQPVSLQSAQGSVSLQGLNTLALGGDAAEVNELLNKRKPKRGVLPKQATNVMRSWLFQHIVHPYPTEDEKRMIAAQTNLTLLQVNNWFINARRRILQPMLDASNPEAAKAKKQKTSNRPSTQRFWPQSLATLGQTPQTAHQPSAGDANKADGDRSSPQSGPVSPELPELQPPPNPMSPSSVMNHSSTGSPRMVKVDDESESDNESGDHNFQPS